MIRGLFVAVAVTLATPASGQWSGTGEDFVKAVREKDGDKAIEILRDRKGTIVNARDSKGDTGLIVAIQRRDQNWIGYLLREGADPNLAHARSGDTPLISAARIGYVDAARWLIDLGAKIDGDNRMGETALIIAVQQRDLPMVRFLLSKGANPDKTDSAAGYSARDYAKRDTRSRELLGLIEAASTPAKKPEKKAETLDQFKL